jgi:hypothetical protein
MNYGITYPNGVAEKVRGDVMDARKAFGELRGAMNDGESISLWAESATGSRVTLESVTQPRIFDISAIMN